MKLFIQIPCFNEAEFLPLMLAQMPRSITGIDEVFWLVVDDGSDDRTSEIASSLGVDFIVRFPQNKGLAQAFSAGIDACLKLGADLIVNTDADNQYPAGGIANLIQPIIDGTADITVGSRDISKIDEFSKIKKILQRVGTLTVRRMSGLKVGDATSGFRAYSREAALKINLVSNYTYTLESLMQAGNSRMSLINVPTERNESIRPSRLFKSSAEYTKRNAWSLFTLNVQFKPLKLFIPAALILFFLGLVSLLPWAIDAASPPTTPHLQSTILASILLITSVQVFLFGLLADAISSVRKLSVSSLERLRVVELELKVPPKLHKTN